MTTILSNLKRHAYGTERADDCTSFADCVWMRIKYGKLFDYRDLRLNILSDLSQVNSALLASDLDYSSFRMVCSHIAGIFLHCKSMQDIAACPNERKDTDSFLWSIVIAWDAILAGDIDNISEHVEMEMKSKTQSKILPQNASSEQ